MYGFSDTLNKSCTITEINKYRVCQSSRLKTHYVTSKFLHLEATPSRQQVTRAWINNCHVEKKKRRSIFRGGEWRMNLVSHPEEESCSQVCQYHNSRISRLRLLRSLTFTLYRFSFRVSVTFICWSFSEKRFSASYTLYFITLCLWTVTWNRCFGLVDGDTLTFMCWKCWGSFHNIIHPAFISTCSRVGLQQTNKAIEIKTSKTCIASWL